MSDDLHIPTAAAALATDWAHVDVSTWMVGRFERAGVAVHTSWLPVQGQYETFVDDPHARVLPLLHADGETYATRQQALDGHDAWVLRVMLALDAKRPTP